MNFENVRCSKTLRNHVPGRQNFFRSSSGVGGQGAAHNRYTGGGAGIGSVRAAKKVVAVKEPPLGPVSLSPESSSCLGGSLHTADPWRGVIVLNFR